MKTALVFGAAGQLGVAVAERLTRTGWRVCAVTRGGRTPPPEVVEGGARLIDGTGKTTGEVLMGLDHPVDAVFDPTAYTVDDARALLSARSRFGALVVVSSSSVYADAKGRSLDEAAESGFPVFDGPITEDTPTVKAGPQTYSTRKVAMEDILRASGLPVSLLRPCAVYGKHGRHPREWWFVKRALDRRRAVPVAYGGESVFHTSSVQGIAALAELCMTSPGARVLNVADSTPLNVAGIAAAIEFATGLPLRLAPFDGAPQGPSQIGGSPWSAEQPFLLDTYAARTLGWKNEGGYAEHVAEVVPWLIETAANDDWKKRFSRFSQYGYDPFDYAAEDEFLAARALGFR